MKLLKAILLLIITLGINTYVLLQYENILLKALSSMTIFIATITTLIRLLMSRKMNRIH